jgi:Zn-dependent metalloprotease
MIFLKKSIIRNYALLLPVSTLLFSATISAQTKSDKTIRHIETNKVDNTPAIINFSQNANWKPDQAQAIFKKYLGVDGASTQMQLQYSTTTKMNVTADRYVQYYKGIKVEYGTYALMSKNGKVDFMAGNYYKGDNTATTTPGISEATAFSDALTFVGAEKYMWQDPAAEQYIRNRYQKDTSYLPHGELAWIEDINGGNDDRKLHLAWSFDIYATKPVSRQKVFVDAITGKILYANSLIKHTAASGHTLYSGVVPFQDAHVGANYLLFDSTRGNGVHTENMHNGTSYGAATEFTTTTNLWPDAVADSQALDAHWGGEIVYDYWKNVQGRLSWDNLNGILHQYVHYSNAYDNAFWDGTEMNYGDGSGCAGGGFTPLTSLDVTAHEIGHGVCQATCNLIYSKESGGIDEGFSDCWGATIENWGNPHEVDAVPKQTWWMGEEIGCGTPLRRLDSPKLFGLPDTYLGVNWYPVTTCTPSGANDECGVHTNMGVISKWYYLLTVGASGTNDIGNSYTVAGQGFTVSQNILYQTELVLANNATYPVLASTSISVATTLYGACSPEVQAVTDAWYAVGVGSPFVPCTPQIGFTNTIMHVSETVASIGCPALKTITIGMKPFGPAITGGTPTVNVLIAPGGTGIVGVDYALVVSSLSWAPGDTSTQYATMTIADNGAINDSKTFQLAFTLSAGGSDASISPTNDTLTVYVDNDDSIPQLGGVTYPILNAGTLVTSNLTSAFTGSDKRANEQFLLFASELSAAGVRKGAPISQIAFNITTKASTAPFIGYTISMGNTALTDMSTAFATGLTTVFTGNVTTNLGMDSINFTTNFTWDGVSNVVVQICYGANAAAFTGNDKMDGIQEGPIVFDNNITNGGAGSGCGLAYNAATQNTARPVVRFKQTIPPAYIETIAGSTRTWNMRSGQEVYFFTPTGDTMLIAGLKNVSDNPGCVTATVTQAGVGFVPAVFSSINRSVKEISITPSFSLATTTYDATMYLTNTELNGVAAGTLFLLKTDEPTDATITPANSVEVTPTLLTGTNYVGFQGSFTGFSRFFLVDGPICTPPPAVITAAGSTTICSPGSVILNANTATGLNYQWEVGGVPISGATTSSYTATTGGSYTVMEYKVSGCDSVSLPVAVTVTSVTAASITGVGTVCIGLTTPLTDATTGGVWSSGSPAIATVDPTGLVSGLTAGTAIISYAVTNTCGTAYATTIVTVSGPTAVSPISGTLTVCIGSNTDLSDASGTGVWSSGNPGIASVGTTGIVTGGSAGTALITYAATIAGCTSSTTAIVTVNALPIVTVSPAGPITLCLGTSATLTASSASGISFQWQAGGSDIAGATNNSYSASATENYGVVTTDANGCSGSSALVSVTVGATVLVPSVSITSSLGDTVCIPAPSETFTANPVNGGAAPAYQWSVNGVVVGAGATFTYVPNGGDVVTCLLTSSAGCATPDTASTSIVMTVSSLMTPAVSITSIHADSTCTGDTVQFIAVPVYGGTDPTYLWTRNDTNVATGPYFIYAPLDGDQLVLTMTSNYPCLMTNVAISDTFTVHVFAPSVNDLAVFVTQSSIISGSIDTFIAIASGAGASPTFQWYINGTPVAGATSTMYITDSLRDGQIVNCRETSSFVCSEPNSVTSGGISVAVGATGVPQVSGISSFTLLPNPNAGSFTIKGSLLSAGDQNASIVITDMLGQTVYSKTITASNGKINQQIDLGNTIANGMYLVSITSGDGHTVFHVVIDK